VIDWASPWVLPLLVLLPLLWWKRLGWANSAGGRILRSLLFLLFVLAWADPIWWRVQTRAQLLVLTEVPPYASEEEADLAASWRETIEESAPRGARLVWQEVPAGYFAAVAADDPTWGERLRWPGGGRILLLGRERNEIPVHAFARWPREADRLPVDTAILAEEENVESGHPRLLAFHVPGDLREGDRFSLQIAWSSPDSGVGRIKIFQMGVLAFEEEVRWEKGRTEWQADGLVAAGPWMRLAWILEGTQTASTVSAGGAEEAGAEVLLQRRGVFPVDGPLRILLLAQGDEDLAGLVSAWEAREFLVERQPPQSWRGSAAGEAAHLLVLTGPATEMLTAPQWEEIRRWVEHDGGGLLFMGGPGAWPREGALRGVGAGLSPLLPRPLEERDKGARAVLVVLDRSGSMNLPVAGATKMTLANEGAARVLSTLAADDFFGVLAVDVAVDTILPLEAGHERTSATETVRNIGVGGGGIYAYPALLDSWRRLRSVPARSKHLIVFADADDVEEKWEGQTTGRMSGPDSLDLATTMRGAGITISVVALGEETDKDVGWLRELARRGNGRFSLTNNAAELPRLFLETAQDILPDPSTGEPFFVTPTPTGQTAFREIEWAEAPPLLGANEVESEPGAVVWLTGREGAPLLARWNLGAGQAATFASSVGTPWAVEWLGWAQGPAFWTQLARTLAAPEVEEVWTMEVSSAPGGRLRLSAHRATTPPEDESGFPPWQIRTETGTPLFPEWQLHAPGRYVAFLLPPDEPLLFQPQTKDGRQLARPLTWNPGPSAPTRSAALALPEISQLTGGRALASPAEVWDFAPAPVPHPTPLRPFLLTAAAILLPIGWLLRRRYGVGS
jgi:Ca-activated chloride channel family protein